MLRDLRDSLRIFMRQPGFAAVIVLTLALGIGATTAIFSLIYGILLRPFPFRESDRLVRVQSTFTNTGAIRGSSLLDVDDFRRRNRTLVDLGAHSGAFDSDIRGDGPAEPIKLTQLQAQAISILGVSPVVGRLFLPEEDRPGGDVHKAVLSYRLWQDRFGGDPSIVGRTIQTNQTTLTVVGVMPPGFGFPDRTDVWTPMESYYVVSGGLALGKRRDARIYSVIARLKPGVSIQQAQADLVSIAEELAREYPQDNQYVRPRVVPLRDAEVGNIRPYLLLLLAAVAFVLLICCANVANLLLARGAVREREIAVRTALGAGRGVILRGHLMESVVLSVAGGILGIALAFLGVATLLKLIPVALPFWMQIDVNPVVLGFALAASISTGVLFGLAPALSAARTDLQSLLKEGARGSSSGGSRLRSALVVAEVGLSVLLLVGAGLMMQTFLRLQRVDPGFQPERILVVRVTKFQPGRRVERAATLTVFHEQVLSRLRALPGVSSAGGASGVPYLGTEVDRGKWDLVVRGRADEDVRHTVALAGQDVSPGYLEAMRIPLLRGRYFDQRDTTTSPMVVIVNERGAKALWPDRDPIGQQVLWGMASADNPYCTVVGVVGNVHRHSGEEDNGIELYYPYTQYPVSAIFYMIRTRGAPTAIASAARDAIRAVDRNAAIVWMKPMEQIMDESLWQRRLWGTLFLVFAALALVLAAIGIYGVMSYMVSQRTREIGIRVALGAGRSTVVAMVLRHGMVLVVAGMASGIGAAWFLARAIRGMLFGVSANDPLIFAAAPLFLAMVALAACYVPARRAAGVDPLVALRQE